MDSTGVASLDDAAVLAGSFTTPALFEELFRRHATTVFKFLARQLNPQVADDLLAETFVAAFRSRDNFDQKFSSARPWLLGIAANVARHHLRSEARRSRLHRRLGSLNPPPADEASEATMRLDGAAFHRRVAVALQALSSEHREVILLAAAGLSYDEIALSLQVPIGTVRSRLSRARAHIKELIGSTGQYQLAEKDELPSTKLVRGDDDGG
jgi:RNA polymerase sigma factor (sigma-70 family)